MEVTASIPAGEMEQLRLRLRAQMTRSTSDKPPAQTAKPQTALPADKADIKKTAAEVKPAAVTLAPYAQVPDAEPFSETLAPATMAPTTLASVTPASELSSRNDAPGVTFQSIAMQTPANQAVVGKQARQQPRELSPSMHPTYGPEKPVIQTLSIAPSSSEHPSAFLPGVPAFVPPPIIEAGIPSSIPAADDAQEWSDTPITGTNRAYVDIFAGMPTSTSASSDVSDEWEDQPSRYSDAPLLGTLQPSFASDTLRPPLAFAIEDTESPTTDPSELGGAKARAVGRPNASNAPYIPGVHSEEIELDSADLTEFDDDNL